ncbi:hypothetical protein ACOME3_003926 [Neoechinorhynchus agilis]
MNNIFTTTFEERLRNYGNDSNNFNSNRNRNLGRRADNSLMHVKTLIRKTPNYCRIMITDPSNIQNLNLYNISRASNFQRIRRYVHCVLRNVLKIYKSFRFRND